jgi:hypothetical protein
MSFCYAIRFVLLFGLIATSAVAEERCLSEETPRQCLQRLIATRAYETAQAALGATTTGTSTATTPVRTALKDFLSAASAQLDGSTVKDSGQSLTLDYNLPGTILGASRQVNLEMTLTDPVLSPVVSAEAANDPVGTALLKDALRRGDDVAIGLTYNQATRRFGRSIVPHKALFDSMLLALISGSGLATASVPAASFDTPFVQILPDPAARIAAMAEFETASIAIMPAAAVRLTEDLKRLAGNQPQFFVTGLYRHRKPAVGPDERGARVTWEIGTDNINSFRRNGGAGCEAQGTCLAAFNDYATRTAARHRTGRLALAIEYHVTDTNMPPLTAPAVTQLSGHTLTWSAVYGQEITSIISGRKGRIDLALTYDGKHTAQNFRTSGLSNSRIAPLAFVAQSQLLPPATTRSSAVVTVTQPLWNGVSIPIAFEWKDELEWLPGTGSPQVSPAPPPGNGHIQPFSKNNQGFNVRIGIRLQVPSFSRPSQPPSKECCCR